MFHDWFCTWQNLSRPFLAKKGLKTRALLNNQQANSEVKKSAFKLRSLLSLHRRMGLVSALFVILLSASGLVIHNSPRLSLDQRFISSSAMLGWYSIEAPDISISFSLGEHRVSLIADSIYFDSIRLADGFNSLIGVVETDFGFLIASNNQLLLVTAEVEMIEALGSVHGIPPGLTAIGGTAEGGIYLRSAEDIFAADLGALSWSSTSMGPGQIQWSLATTPAAELAELIKADYSASLLSWERLILDIHSGRFLGSLGVVLVDIMALLFIFMGITGVWIWSRRRS